MKKILILTVTAGNAHNACAQTMRRAIGQRAEVEIVDLFKAFSPRRYAWFSGRGYELAVEKLLPVYNLFYEHYRRADPRKRYRSATQRACLSAVAGLMQKLKEFRPDAVFCTHYNCAVALTDLRLVCPLPCFIVSACLDYTLSPFWESAIGVDRMVIPSEQFIAPCLERGYRAEQLLPYGLPVDVRFVGRGERDGIPTVLILFGGGTWGGVEKLFRAADIPTICPDISRGRTSSSTSAAAEMPRRCSRRGFPCSSGNASPRRRSITCDTSRRTGRRGHSSGRSLSGGSFYRCWTMAPRGRRWRSGRAGSRGAARKRPQSCCFPSLPPIGRVLKGIPI